MNDPTPQARKAADAIDDYMDECGVCLSRRQVAELAALIDRHTRLPEVLGALAPIVHFAEQLERKPMRQIGDDFYMIHSGTEYEATLRFSDFARIRTLLADGDTAEQARRAGKEQV